jgi:hypothetical protein
MEDRLPLDSRRGPFRRRAANVVGAAGEKLGETVDNHESAGLHVSESNVEVDQVSDKDNMVENEGAEVGERHDRS